jgi:sialic acid synthase SpsE
MVRGIREAAASLGDGEKRPVDAERPVARVARRSLHWTRALGPGTTVTADDLAVLRPATGLPPMALDVLVGARVARSVVPGTPVELDDLAPDEPVWTGLAHLGLDVADARARSRAPDAPAAPRR